MDISKKDHTITPPLVLGLNQAAMSKPSFISTDSSFVEAKEVVLEEVALEPLMSKSALPQEMPGERWDTLRQVVDWYRLGVRSDWQQVLKRISPKTSCATSFVGNILKRQRYSVRKSLLAVEEVCVYVCYIYRRRREGGRGCACQFSRFHCCPPPPSCALRGFLKILNLRP